MLSFALCLCADSDTVGFTECNINIIYSNKSNNVIIQLY